MLARVFTKRLVQIHNFCKTFECNPGFCFLFVKYKGLLVDFIQRIDVDNVFSIGWYIRNIRNDCL